MSDNGACGTGGTVSTGSLADPGHPIVSGKRVWDVNLWNSARLDTIETNIWLDLNVGASTANSGGSDWMATYHETDPKYGTLGISRNRCFLVDPSGSLNCSSKAPTSTAQCNIICGTVPNAGTFVGTYPPAWTAGAGLVAEDDGAGGFLPIGHSYEGTKIIPDGQLTAGSFVQYFCRKAPGSTGPVA